MKVGSGVGGRHEAELEVGLKRINRSRQVVGFAAGEELLEGIGRHYGVAYVDNEPDALPEMVGPFDNDIQGPDALGCYMTLSGHLGVITIKIQTYQNPEFLVQKLLPSMHGRDAATVNHSNPEV
ncbi:hypothetical protein [Pseudarthrobacter sp. N5]|uniref:hypothetical protein n=1 Tax=Pseudarthrobacter sp. N5 TaxID=3418416 RepID=UPI003CEC018E